MIELYCGENEFALAAAVREHIDSFLRTHDAFGLERFDGEESTPSQIKDSLQQLPFLAPKKLVVIKNVFASKQLQELLTESFTGIPDEIDCLLVDNHADKRTKLYKQLAADGKIREFVSLKGTSLTNWAVTYATSQGGTLAQVDAQYLIDRVGMNQMLLAREIEKLSVFGAISRELIATHTEQALRGSVFDLLDKIFSGKIDEGLALYDRLVADKTDPNEILGVIAWQLHVFALVMQAGKGSAEDVAKKANLHPFVVGKALSALRNISQTLLKQNVAAALSADISIKTSPVDAADAIRVLLLDFAH